MDAQLRRGILDACVLAVLERGESYGYKLVADISTFIEITESTDAGRARIDELLGEWEEIIKVYKYIAEERGEKNA